jgi:two-component system OmpR family sensor kinase
VSSIRGTLLATLLLAVSTVTLAAAFFVYRLARQQMDAIFDYQLRQLALSLRSLPSRVEGAPEDFDFVVQIWDQSGARLYVSRSDSGLPEAAQIGFATVSAPGGDWRVYTTGFADLIVEVAQPMRVRERYAFAASVRTLAPVLLILPLLAFLVWRIVGRSLAPLEHLAQAVGSRTPASLQPLPESDAPAEALPLVRSVNDLLRRLGAALDTQRAFVADAAHGLRTPLAALKLQLQLVERASDAGERRAALADLRAGRDRTTHVVQQLLTLARAEPEAAAALAGEPVSLAELVGEAVADHSLVAETKGVDLGATEAAKAAVVTGDATALRSLLSNLVENAIRHTPRGGRIDLAAGVADARPYLEVADNGPGIAEGDRARVFDRFYRRGSGADSGSGLGLAIVKAIADRHSATVSLHDTAGGGLTVRVDFPLAAAAPRQSAEMRVQDGDRAP